MTLNQKKMFLEILISRCLVTVGLAGLSVQLSVQALDPPPYAIQPTSKTLPDGIWHTQFTTANTFANFAYDENGKLQKNGVSYNRWITGTQIEYGVNSTLTFGIGIPYVASNNASIDGNAFQSTEFFQKYYNRALNDVANNLMQRGVCSSMARCVDGINDGSISLPGLPLVLPTGEIKHLGAGNIADQLRDVVVQAASPTDGASGLGDIQIGVLWNPISENSPAFSIPLYFAVGGGLRLPTGRFDLPSAMRATGGDGTLITGGGTYDAFLRWNFDYVPLAGVIFSWQHQMEVSLSKANLHRSSMLDPTLDNTSDPTGNTLADQVGNTLIFSRKGVHEIGFLQAAWNAGNIEEKARWLGLYTQAKYNIAAQAYLNNMPIYAMGDQFYLDDGSLHIDHGYEQYYSAILGTKLSGLPYLIPVEVSAEFEYPFYGKNRLVSPMNVQAVVGVYF